ncbi:MAG: MBOAT family protein [Oscillospiraceae bacterium]|nr:MBOAT family protein [Oscillospiraceae bacterium]
MVFSSAIFLFAFLPLVFLLERLCRGTRAKNILLAGSSLVFYAFGQLGYLPLFLLSVGINYAAGLLLQRARRGRKAVLAAAVVLDLAILGLFKYTDFVLGILGREPLGILLPIGISFYTFQGMSYVIDVYRDPASGTRDLGKLLLYLAFFPQLIAGPIVKYHDIAPQIDARQTDPLRTEEGLRRFIRGLAKKLLVADSVGRIADAVFGGAVGDPRLAWLGALCYLLQIYYDFSGYSDMAIGMGRMFGFTIRENFLHPYGAGSLREFWRRWHVSLSAWFREYLYIPLGGNRRGKGRAALNRLLVFFCTGLWHGANWTFVLWGLGHGLLCDLERALPVEKLQKSALGRLLGRILTLLAVTLLFVLFRAESLSAAWAMFRAMFAGTATAAGTVELLRLLQPAAVATIALAVLFAGGLREKLEALLPEALAPHLLRVGSVALLLLSILSLSAGGYHPFLYFQF